MFATMFPVILAGVLNMLFVKTKFCKKHSLPIDGGKNFIDGKRIFGDNKTWIGFFGMIAAGAASQALCGIFCKLFNGINYFYDFHENTLPFNILAGAAIGFTYVLFELPNSFVKRRIDIPAGKTARGLKGAVFYIMDQIDSLIGVGLVFAVIYPMPVWQYFLYILFGAVIHSIVNMILWKIRIRKNF